jgi:hypothetical protein
MSAAVSEDDYARFNWHERQRLNDRLAAETRRLQTEATQLEARIRALNREYAAKVRAKTRNVEERAAQTARENAAHMAECNRQLAALNAERDTEVRPPQGSTRAEPQTWAVA